MTPLLTPPWSILFGWGRKWSSRTATFFLLGGGGGGGEEEEEEYFFVVAIAFKSFILKHDTATSIFLNISVQDCGFYLKIINDSKVLLR